MKKIVLAAVALLCLCGTAAAQRHIEFRWHGFYCVGDMSYGVNLNRSANDNNFADTVGAFMPSISAGYMFRKEAVVGLGATYVADANGAFTQLPVYVELRSHFMRSRLTPYTVLQVGYSLPLGVSSDAPSTKIEEGGLYVGLSVGGRYAFSRSLALGLHLDYKLLQSNVVSRHDMENAPMLNEPVVLHMLGGGLSVYFSN